MRFVLLSFLFILIHATNTTSFAQANYTCGYLKQHTVHKTTVADPGEDDYDVHYVKLDLTTDNMSTALSGSATTVAQVVATTMNAYIFELKNDLTIDSVIFNGTSLAWSTLGDVRKVSLSTALLSGNIFTAQVFYHGSPVSGNLFGAEGFNTIASPSWGNQATFSLSQPYRALEWWPCKQSLRDKIDSCDIWITIPDSLKAGSNGLLQAITRVDTHTVRYEWKERYPIDYYLISIAVANYIDYTYYVHFPGSTDSMPVQNYVYNNAGTLPRFRGAIDTTGMTIQFFSSLLGRYPFWKEKYGHCMAPLSGGMEHQTMTTLGFFNGTLVAHELGHQWFGDNVTCGSWADIFVNESFASYSEYMYLDHFEGHTAATNDMIGRQSNVVSAAADGTVFTPDTSTDTRIFDSRLSYDKGACVLHMLRFVLNNDTLFFNTFKTYQNQFTGSTGTIDNFENVTKTLAGTNVGGLEIDTFFNQWLYRQGYPVYDVRWMQQGTDVFIKINQSSSFLSNVSLFFTPIEIKLRSAAGDTTVKIFNNASSQVFHFNWSKPMTTLDFDPNFWLLYQLNSLAKDTALSVHQTMLSAAIISPNPTTQAWQVSHLERGTQLELFDLNGRLLWARRSEQPSETVPAGNLPAGVYLLKLTGDAGTECRRIIKE